MIKTDKQKKAPKVIGEGKKDGRPLAKIDWNIVESLCKIQCTGQEIAGVLGINYDTLYDRIKRDFGITFVEYNKRFGESGKASLRRIQFKLAEKSPAMAIWLGKQYLGQKEPNMFIEDLSAGVPEFSGKSDAELDETINKLNKKNGNGNSK